MTYGNSPGSEDALFASGDDFWVQPLDFLEWFMEVSENKLYHIFLVMKDPIQIDDLEMIHQF